MFLPGARGFDTYLGIPYSDDMGQAARSPCPGDKHCGQTVIPSSDYEYTLEDNVHGEGDLGIKNLKDLNDNGVDDLSPLVFQSGGVPSTPNCGTDKTLAYAKNTTIIEQPVDFSKLAPKYNDFVLDFIERSHADPFFLYMPFSHVHTTAGNQPQKQYASCQFQNTSIRGAFGDAIKEVDWIVGNVVDKLRTLQIMYGSTCCLHRCSYGNADRSYSHWLRCCSRVDTWIDLAGKTR
jgi:hypothetical protein